MHTLRCLLSNFSARHRPFSNGLTYLTLCSVVTLLSSVTGCSSDDKPDTPPSPVVGTMIVTGASTASENASYEMRTRVACTRNADTGRLDIEIAQEGVASLTLAIKDFQSTAKTYTCKQAADNKTSISDVGGKFDSCAVVFRTPFAAGSKGLNTYSTYRASTDVKPFSYVGACSIEATAAAPNFVAKVNCKSAVQTGLDGAARNPIDAKVTASITADVNCPL